MDKKENNQRKKPEDIQEKEQRESFARAATEDDDGYDPWSDRPVKDPFWEEDPWR